MDAEGINDEACYYKVAKATNNDSICEKISNIYMRDDCYERIAESLGSISLCDKIMEKNTVVTIKIAKKSKIILSAKKWKKKEIVGKR